MRVSEFITEYLVSIGTTDAFGVPGGVILELIYAIEETEGIEAHLCYHEQSAGFAAIGYAQSSNKLGLAYSTKGPGFTNLITTIAEAYTGSIPVLFLTSHISDKLPDIGRFETEQELDTCAMVKNITKLSLRIDSVRDFERYFKYACEVAKSDRFGPVFLDISNSVLKSETNMSLTESMKNYMKRT